MDGLDELRARYLEQVAAAGDEAALESVRVSALGKKGEVALMMRELGRMTPEERKTAGPALNALKDEINAALAARKAALADAALAARLETEWLDVTLPPRPRPQGTLHPISQVTEEVVAIFAEMGFGVKEGPRSRTTTTISTPSTFPAEHPARTEMDTFYMSQRAGATPRRRTCCAPTPRRCRSAACWPRARPAGSSAPAASIAATTTRPTRRCSIRSRGWRSTATSRWPI
jgi:phenylalanyl-tRNA synthetase alpha chain